MPTYQYHCQKCAATFERTETISEHETAKPQCPKCEQEGFRCAASYRALAALRG
jgi:putative FmdB family regulatory protein